MVIQQDVLWLQVPVEKKEQGQMLLSLLGSQMGPPPPIWLVSWDGMWSKVQEPLAARETALSPPQQQPQLKEITEGPTGPGLPGLTR